MKRRAFWIVGLAAGLLAGGAAAAQTAPPPPDAGARAVDAVGPADPNDRPPAADAPEPRDITVTGRSREATHDLVKAITQAPRDEPIARFYDWVCVEVSGLRPDLATILGDEIRAAVREAGVKVESGRCRTNLLVVVPPDANAFTAALLQRYPALFGQLTKGMASPELVAALRRPRAVRWFETRLVLQRDASAFRLEQGVRGEKRAAYVIVDLDRLDGLRWHQLGAYIAMVALTEPKMDATYPPGSTILSLFAERAGGGAGPAELTAGDRALLRSYNHVDDALPPEQQRLQIAHDMQRR